MFIELLSVCTLKCFCESLASNSKGTMKCLSPNNRPYQTRPTRVDINSNETLFYPFTVSVNKCGGGCNTFGNSYGRVCVPNKVKNMSPKVFNLMLEASEIRFLVQNTLNESVYNLK